MSPGVLALGANLTGKASDRDGAGAIRLQLEIRRNAPLSGVVNDLIYEILRDERHSGVAHCRLYRDENPLGIVPVQPHLLRTHPHAVTKH